MLFPTRLVASCAAVALTVGVAAPAMAAIPVAPAAKAAPAASTAPLALSHDAPTGKSQEVFHLSTTPGASRAGEIAYAVLDAGKKGGNVILESALVNAAGKVSFDVPLGVKGKHSLTIITKDAAGGTDFASQSRLFTAAPDGVSVAEEQLTANALGYISNSDSKQGLGSLGADSSEWEYINLDDEDLVPPPNPEKEAAAKAAEAAGLPDWPWGVQDTVKSAMAFTFALIKGFEKGDVKGAMLNYGLSLIGIDLSPNPAVTEIDLVEKQLSAEISRGFADMNRRFDAVTADLDAARQQITDLQTELNTVQDQAQVSACQNQLLKANDYVNTIDTVYTNYQLTNTAKWAAKNLKSTDTLAESSSKAAKAIFGVDAGSDPAFQTPVVKFQKQAVTPLAALLVPGGTPGSAGLIPTCASAVASLATIQKGLATKGGDPILGATDDFYFNNLQAINNYYSGWAILGQSIAQQGEMAVLTYDQNPAKASEAMDVCRGTVGDANKPVVTCEGLVGVSAQTSKFLTQATNLTGASWSQMTGGMVKTSTGVTGTGLKPTTGAWMSDIAEFNSYTTPVNSTYRPHPDAPSAGVSALNRPLFKGLLFSPATTANWDSAVANPSRLAYPGASATKDVTELCSTGISCADPLMVYQRMDASGFTNAGASTKNLILYTGEQTTWQPSLQLKLPSNWYYFEEYAKQRIDFQPVKAAMFLDTSRRMVNGMSVVIGAQGSPIDASSVFSGRVTFSDAQWREVEGEREATSSNDFEHGAEYWRYVVHGQGHVVSKPSTWVGTPGQGIPQSLKKTGFWLNSSYPMIADPASLAGTDNYDNFLQTPGAEVKDWTNQLRLASTCGEVDRRGTQGLSWLWASVSNVPAGSTTSGVFGGTNWADCTGKSLGVWGSSYYTKGEGSPSHYDAYSLTHSKSMYLSGGALNTANLDDNPPDNWQRATPGIDPGTKTPDFLEIPAWHSSVPAPMTGQMVNIPTKKIKQQYMWPVINVKDPASCNPTSFTNGVLNTVNVMQGCQALFTAYTAAQGTVNGPVRVVPAPSSVAIGSTGPRELAFQLYNTSSDAQRVLVGLSGLNSDALPQGSLSVVNADGTHSDACTLVPSSTDSSDSCWITVAPGTSTFSQQLVSTNNWTSSDLAVGVSVSSSTSSDVNNVVYSTHRFKLDPNSDDVIVDIRPATPTGLTAVEGGHHLVKLTWNVPAAAGKIDSYKIIGTGPDGQQVFQTRGHGTMTEENYSQLTVPVSGKWSFTVTAVQADPVLESLPSEPATVDVAGEDFENAVTSMYVKVPRAGNQYVGYISWRPSDNKAPGLSFTIHGSSDKGDTMADVTIPGQPRSNGVYQWDFPKKALAAGTWTFTITGTSDHGDLIPASETVTALR